MNYHRIANEKMNASKNDIPTTSYLQNGGVDQIDVFNNDEHQQKIEEPSLSRQTSIKDIKLRDNDNHNNHDKHNQQGGGTYTIDNNRDNHNQQGDNINTIDNNIYKNIAFLKSHIRI